MQRTLQPQISGGANTQVAFHRSLVTGHCFTFWKVTKTLSLANPRPKTNLRPRVSQVEGFWVTLLIVYKPATTGSPHKRCVCLYVQNIKKCMGNIEES